MRDWDELLKPWDSEPGLVPERRFTVWADPRWRAWNEHAVEFEVALFLQHLTQALSSRRRGIVVVETGTGQGFVTRRVAEAINPERDVLWVFESDHEWRSELLGHHWFYDRFDACLKEAPTPSWEQMGAADLVILDSNDPWRLAELFLWHSCAKEGSILFVHDASPGHPTWDGHFLLAHAIMSSQIPGTFLENPRGAFVAVKGSLVVDQWILQLWTVVLEQTMARA